MLCLSLSTFAQTIATPEQYLYSIPKPNFKRGHTLKLLTYTGWGSENSNTVVELADKWGYALDFGVATRYGVTTLLTNSQNRNYGFAQLVNSDSNKFKAAWHCIKQFDIESYLTSGYTNKDQVTGRFYSKSCYATNASGDYFDF